MKNEQVADSTSRLVASDSLRSVVLLLSLVAIALYSATLSGLVPRPGPVRTRLAALEQDATRRRELEAKRPELQREVGTLQEQLRQLDAIVPRTPEEATQRMTDLLGQFGARKVEVLQAEWSREEWKQGKEVVAVYGRGDLRVRITTGAWSWRAISRRLPHAPQILQLESVEIADLADPACPALLHIVLHSREPPAEIPRRRG